jgi:hypothetical protein
VCQHGVRLANTRGRAEENPKLAAPIFFSDSEQRIRIGTAIEVSLLRRHGRQTLS